MEATIRRLKHDKKGISNVLVVMLSLVLVTVIVANVVLWSYQMDQLDWEKTQEKLKVLNVERNFVWLENSSLHGSFIERSTSTEQWMFYPQNYALLGGTQYVSGTISDLQNNTSSYMKFRSYSQGITYHSATRDTPLTVSSTTYTEYLPLTFTSENQAKYLVLGYIELTCSSTGQQARAQFLQDTTILASYFDRPRVANTEVMPQMFAYIYTGTGNDVTFKWQISASSSGVAATALRGRIYALRIDNLPNVEYQSVYEGAERANMDNVWGDDSGDTYEIIINPLTAGYYLIWASAKVESDSTTSSVSVRLNIDNGAEYIPYLIGGESTWSYARIEDTSTNEEHCFAILAVRQFAAGQHSIKFQIADIDAAVSADWQYVSLLAIRLTDVFEFYNASTVTQAQTTQTTLQTYTSLNIPSGKAGDYLILGGITTRGSSTSYDYETALTIDDVTYGRQQIRPQDTNDYVPKVFMQNITFDDGSHTIATKYRALNSAMTVYVKNSDIVAIRLPRAEQTVEVEFAGSSNLEDWMSLTWTVDARCTTDNVAATFQLYQTGGYPNSGDGYISAILGTTDVTVSQIITVNPTGFRDPATSLWRLKIKVVKTTPMPFELWVDFIELKAESEGETYSLFLIGDFNLELAVHPIENIFSIETHIRFKASDTGEYWVLEVYNWVNGHYEEVNILLPARYFKDYVLNLGDNWQNYVNSSNGTIRLAFHDENGDIVPTTLDIDFFAVKVILKHGVVMAFDNQGASTMHIVAIWINNATVHKRYDVDIFINVGETLTVIREDISLPDGWFMVKAVTERGNIGVFEGS
ncbi:MAG: hypothetical protein QXW82_02320 [Candidatus Bathyarchaeia archaeon]